jgi:predicted enzyme related to lactoylglutathione lyase
MKRLSVVSLFVSDYDSAIEFYTRKLGFTWSRTFRSDRSAG